MNGRCAAALAFALLATTTARAEAGCDRAKARGLLVEELRLGHAVDVHHLARALSLLCEPPDDEWAILDALALVELDETERARQQLVALTTTATDESLRTRARVLLAWTHLATNDADAFAATIAPLDVRDRTRLELLAAADDADRFAATLARWPANARGELAALHARYDDARTLRRPWLAGTLSALLPGAGQVYAGSWQAAAVAFVLNGVFITATVELGRRDLWAAAAATGLGASFVYLGNILNAAELARRRSETAAAPARATLEEHLVPERRPWLDR